MKMLFTLLLCGLLGPAFGQQAITNNNSLSVTIDGKDYTTQPRRVRVGTFWWVTANAISPDRSLRLWLNSFDGRADAFAPGQYLVVDADKGYTKETHKRVEALGNYKGLAIIKYVEETRSPRMEYKMGKSQNGDDVVEVMASADGTLEATFSGSLAGTTWKEKAGATVFGGVGRLINKLEDKAVTSATGYDQDIDPEGRGYRKTGSTDPIVLTNGKFKLKL